MGQGDVAARAFSRVVIPDTAAVDSFHLVAAGIHVLKWAVIDSGGQTVMITNGNQSTSPVVFLPNTKWLPVFMHCENGIYAKVHTAGAVTISVGYD